MNMKNKNSKTPIDGRKSSFSYYRGYIVKLRNADISVSTFESNYFQPSYS